MSMELILKNYLNQNNKQIINDIQKNLPIIVLDKIKKII